MMGFLLSIPRALQALLARVPVGDWDTLGPTDEARDDRELPRAAPPAPAPNWVDGWYGGAITKPAHPRRGGGPIRPWSVVVHTTDMAPNTFQPLVRNWTTKEGQRNAAHFILGRTSEDGLVQVLPITRNGAHAGAGGGKPHGWYRTVAGKLIHPNSVAVGIEVHCAGLLYLHKGQWIEMEGSPRAPKKGGPVYPASDVEVDPRFNGLRGWHKPTAYQVEQLALLLAELDEVLAPVPKGITLKPSGIVPSYGRATNCRFVGHVSLDPERKSDPGVPIMRWLREWCAARAAASSR